MDPVALFLLTIAGIFIIGIVGEIVFEKTGVPDVVWLIAVGIILNVSGVVDSDKLGVIAPFFGALTLVVVLFDGGSELRLKDLSEAAPRSALLAVCSFILSAGLLTVAAQGAAWVGWLPASWGWLHSVILGSILGGSSSVVIMPALRTAKLSPRLSNLVNLESALTDVLCVVLTVACLDIARSGSTDPAGAGMALLRSFGIGIVVGGVAGIMALLVLRRLRKSQHAYPLLLGSLLVLYVVIDYLKGSAALGILTVAVMVGNAPELSKAVGLAKKASLSENVENVHDQIAFFIKSFFFVFIGAMLSPPWSLLALGGVFGLLLLIARIPAVHVATLGSSHSKAAKGLIAVSMPRGMAAGVLAIMPAAVMRQTPQGPIAALPGTEELPVVVFAAVVMTILVFAVGFPIMKRKLGPADLIDGPNTPPEEESVSEDSSAETGGESLPADQTVKEELFIESDFPDTSEQDLPSLPDAIADAEALDTVEESSAAAGDESDLEPESEPQP